MGTMALFPLSQRFGPRARRRGLDGNYYPITRPAVPAVRRSAA